MKKSFHSTHTYVQTYQNSKKWRKKKKKKICECAKPKFYFIFLLYAYMCMWLDMQIKVLTNTKLLYMTSITCRIFVVTNAVAFSPALHKRWFCFLDHSATNCKSHKFWLMSFVQAINRSLFIYLHVYTYKHTSIDVCMQMINAT